MFVDIVMTVLDNQCSDGDGNGRNVDKVLVAVVIYIDSGYNSCSGNRCDSDCVCDYIDSDCKMVVFVMIMMISIIVILVIN